MLESEMEPAAPQSPKLSGDGHGKMNNSTQEKKAIMGKDEVSATSPASVGHRRQRSDANEEFEYPPFRTVVIVMIALYICLFLVALDRIIIGTAIPQITNDFDSLADVGWYGSAYLLTSCATQLLYGRLYNFYNNKTVFLMSIGLFEVGSALCGAAPNSIAFILGRAIAGSGSAGVFSGTIAITIPLVPLHKRPMYQAFLGAVFGIASIVGPLVGGAFTTNTNLTWRWCFYINLPIGAVSIAIVSFFLKLQPPPRARLSLTEKIKGLDPLGNFFFAPSIIALLLALQWGGSEYAWNSARIIALLVVFAILLIAFILVQIIFKDIAMIPPRIMTQRSIASGFLFSLCIGAVMLSFGLYLPIWFQAITGVDALQSGIRGIPLILSLVVASIVGGGIVQSAGYYTPVMIASSCIISIGSGLLTTLTVDSGSPQWIGYQVLLGFGTGLGMQQSGMAAQVVLPTEDVPIGASLMFLAQSLGGSIFVAASQNVFIGTLMENLRGIEGIDALLLTGVGATDLRKLVTGGELGKVLVAYNSAIMRAFVVGVVVACLSVVPAGMMEWRSVKRGKIAKVEGGRHEKGETV